MELITIEIKYHVMKCHEGKLKKARLVWRAPGLHVYVVGSLSGHLFNQAQCLAMNLCENRHIPVSSLRKVGKYGA